MLDVLTIGDILIDMVAPDAQGLQSAHVFYRTAGGAPANAAVAAARLGARSGFIGAVGKDAFGDFLRETLANHGVNTDALIGVPYPTTLAIVANNLGGIPEFVFYHGSDSQLLPKHVPRETIGQARFLCAGLTAMSLEPTRSAVYTAVDAASRGEALVCIDPNLRPSSWPSLEQAIEVLQPLLASAHILKINDTEAALLTGEPEPRAAARSLAIGDRLVIVTLGGEGCLWHWNGESGGVPAPSVEVQDTTGAGDAFLGAFLAELSRQDVTRRTFAELNGDSISGACAYACAAAAFACTKVGAMAALPTRDDIARLLG